MVKVKNIRTADCVVGGFRYATARELIGSLLLGLYDDAGLLHHVGFTSAFKSRQTRALTKKFEALKKAARFHRKRSRWSEPLEYGAHRRMGAGRSESCGRSGLRSFYWRTVFVTARESLGWRPDKAPRQCTLDQVAHREGEPSRCCNLLIRACRTIPWRSL